jgi:glycosyltransferase involved in cell wall biosynthesis
MTFVHGNAPLETVGALMSVADVSLSLVGTLEPVSWSVQQAVACGSAVIVTDQASYALEEARGLSVHRLLPGGAAELCAAIAHLLDDADRRTAMARANERYVTLHHDRETELTRLLRIVAGAATADRLLAAGTVRG